MALQKDKVTDIGVTANYWRVVLINVNYRNKTSHVEMELYLSHDARMAGSNSIETVTFDWSDGLGDWPFGDLGGRDTRQVAYDQIKLDPAFSDAVDA